VPKHEKKGVRSNGKDAEGTALCQYKGGQSRSGLKISGHGGEDCKIDNAKRNYSERSAWSGGKPLWDYHLKEVVRAKHDLWIVDTPSCKRGRRGGGGGGDDTGNHENRTRGGKKQTSISHGKIRKDLIGLRASTAIRRGRVGERITHQKRSQGGT